MVLRQVPGRKSQAIGQKCALGSSTDNSARNDLARRRKLTVLDDPGPFGQNPLTPPSLARTPPAGKASSARPPADGPIAVSNGILAALVRKAAKEAAAGEEDGENGQAEKKGIAMPNCVV
jgi:hypothetical protein